MEIKCQLDATDEFLLQILLLAQRVSGTIMPIIRSSRVLYKRLLPVAFGAWFSSCRYGVELRVVCPVCGQQPANRTKNHLLHLVGILFPLTKKSFQIPFFSINHSLSYFSIPYGMISHPTNHIVQSLLVYRLII